MLAQGQICPLVDDTTVLSLEEECPASPTSPVEGVMWKINVMIAKVDSVPAEC